MKRKTVKVKAAANREELQKFCSSLALIKEQAGRLGLFCTMQLLEEPLRMSGYEAAGSPEAYFQQKDLYDRTKAKTTS